MMLEPRDPDPLYSCHCPACGHEWTENPADYMDWDEDGIKQHKPAFCPECGACDIEVELEP